MRKAMRTVFFTLSVFLLVAGTVMFLSAEPASAKTRFNVGWTADMAIDTLGVTSDWQYGWMGNIWWQLIYDALWMYGPAPNYDPIPMLAESWETKDRKTFVYHLRKNAKFHDGKPVTAHDVAFTLSVLIDQEPSFQYPDTIHESTRVIDDHTIEVTLKDPSGGRYPAVGWVPIFPKHIWEPHKDDITKFKNENAIGSGPYKLKEYKHKEYVWFEANKEHWGEGMYRPQVDEVVFKCYGSQDAIKMAIKRGEVDMLGYAGISALSMDEFEGKKDIEVIQSPGISVAFLTFNLHKPMLQNKNLRKAMMYGIDRKRLVDMVYVGYGQEQYGYIYPELSEHNPNLPQYKYNPEMAKKLLADDGYTDTDGDDILNDPKSGDNLSFRYMISSELVDLLKITRIFKEEMIEIGIDIELWVVDEDTAMDFAYTPTDDKWDLTMGYNDPGPNPWWIWEFMRSYADGGEGWNSAWYNNPEFDKLLNGYHASLDIAERKQICWKMQEMMAEDLPYGALVRPDNLSPVRTDKLEGYTPTMGGPSCWSNVWTYFNIRPKP